jgi:hypothetical protein
MIGTVVSDAAREHVLDAVRHTRMHHAAGEHAALDGRADAAGRADGVDGSKMVVVAAGHRRPGLEPDAE